MRTEKRKRAVFSIKNELIQKSQDSALCAVQIYNNPSICFKTESFIVLMVIAWTYLLHAYYREKGIEYRYYRQSSKKRIFSKTKNGNHKYWELERCLNEEHCPLEKSVKANLRFLIELRHEIEHQMTTRIDEFISGKIQACCLNYNAALKALFDTDIAHHQPLSIQFFSFGEEQITSLKNKPDIPKNVIGFVTNFEQALDADELSSPQYSYRVIYIRENANHLGQADSAFRFISEDSVENEEIQNVLIKTRRYKDKKLTQDKVVEKAHLSGYKSLTGYQHQKFWQNKWPNAAMRNKEAKKYGELVLRNQWLWYEETWLPLVLEYCKNGTPLTKMI